MMQFVWLACALCLIVFGMGALALGMARHYQQVFGTPAPAGSARRWRLAGSGALALALLCCTVGWGVAIGIVLWVGLLAVGVLVSALALAGRR